MKTLVIIPTLNESQNISKLLVKLSRLYKNIDILVVDDNSTDGTYDIVLKLASKLKNIKIISRKKDIGIGSAHLRGISYAYKKKYHICITMDADGTHDPKKIRHMLKIIKLNKFQIINTNRFKDKKSIEDWPLIRRAITLLRFFLVKLLLNTDFDSSGGFRCYNLYQIKKSHFYLAKNKNYFFLIESLYFFQKLNYKIYEISNKLKFRSANKSKMKIKHIFESFYDLLSLRFKN